MSTPNLALPYIAPSQAQKHVTHNEALRLLDGVVQLSVVTSGTTLPPVNPVEAERHIVGGGATGAWLGQDQSVAEWQDGYWVFRAPRVGWLAFVAATGGFVVFESAGWRPAFSGGAETMPRLGINTVADVANRLSVSSPAVLFNHDGAGSQVKINKAGHPQ